MHRLGKNVPAIFIFLCVSCFQQIYILQFCYQITYNNNEFQDELDRLQ